MPPAPARKNRVRLAIASYSYWHFRTAKVPIETVMDRAAELGVAVVDILHRQMELGERAPLDAAGRSYLHRLKRHAFRQGLEICCVSTHQSFVKPKPDELTLEVEHTKKCIELAYELGCPSIRINTGRWGTTRSFDALMANRGIEPVLPGHTEEEGFKWCIEGIIPNSPSFWTLTTDHTDGHRLTETNDHLCYLCNLWLESPGAME